MPRSNRLGSKTMQVLHRYSLTCVIGHSKKPPDCGGFSSESDITKSLNYFAAGLSPGFAYLRRKRSTRPAVSTNFCLPVKKGWHAEQISTEMSPLCVERVVKLLPHAQCTRIGSYVG